MSNQQHPSPNKLKRVADDIIPQAKISTVNDKLIQFIAVRAGKPMIAEEVLMVTDLLTGNPSDASIQRLESALEGVDPNFSTFLTRMESKVPVKQTNIKIIRKPLQYKGAGYGKVKQKPQWKRAIEPVVVVKPITTTKRQKVNAEPEIQARPREPGKIYSYTEQISEAAKAILESLDDDFVVDTPSNNSNPFGDIQALPNPYLAEMATRKSNTAIPQKMPAILKTIEPTASIISMPVKVTTPATTSFRTPAAKTSGFTFQSSSSISKDAFTPVAKTTPIRLGEEAPKSFLSPKPIFNFEGMKPTPLTTFLPSTPAKLPITFTTQAVPEPVTLAVKDVPVIPKPKAVFPAFTVPPISQPLLTPIEKVNTETFKVPAPIAKSFIAPTINMADKSEFTWSAPKFGIPDWIVESSEWKEEIRKLSAAPIQSLMTFNWNPII